METPVGSKSDYLEAAILNHVLGATVYTAPATVFMALYTATPSDTGGGTEVATGNWSNYARTAIVNNSTNWPNVTGTSPTTKTNGASIAWSATTQTADLTLVAWALYDALTAGNELYWGALGSNKIIQSGDTPSIAVAACIITED